jgi:nucleoporin NUP42
LVQAAEHQIQNALDNINGAIDYILAAENKHPNRIDIVQDAMAPRNNKSVFAEGKTTTPFQAANSESNTFGAPTQPALSTFGAPTIVSANGAFGQPSAFGSKPNPFTASSQPAFGTPTFGAPSQSGAGGSFGQPAALGQKPSPFGAPSGGGFSSFANSGNTFGQPSQPARSNPFAAPSQSALANGASYTPFGAPSPAPKNPFGAPSSQTPAPNPFGEASAPKSNPFVSGTPAAANPFSTAQRTPPANSNNFGTPSNGTNQASVNPFGQSAPTVGVNSFNSAPSAYQPATSGDTQHPPLSSYATIGPNNRLSMFKGRRVVYKDGQPGFEGRDRIWQKIWFPEGAPMMNKDSEMEDVKYDDQTKAAYMSLRQTGNFPGDVMPFRPPKREWGLWDF